MVWFTNRTAEHLFPAGPTVKNNTIMIIDKP